MTKPVIAIDGPAASGKGTLSRNIAQTLNYGHMDTGALYRAVALRVLRAGSDPEDTQAAIHHAQDFADHFSPDDLKDPALRHDETGLAASKVAPIQPVRDILLRLQRDFAKDPGNAYDGAVLDGRDIGTVVCPDAHAKIFMIASPEVRAQRRTKELQSAGQGVTYEAVLKDMRERDARDSGRQTSPMKPADDALSLDTSEMNQQQVLEKALDFIKEKLEA